ncbi:MAG: hypothetical protein R2873_12770 [Caldilineaceae bacterium]
MVEIDTSTGTSSKRFVVIFVLALAALLVAFTLMVRWAVNILPQQDEVITVEDAAAYIERGEVERILIQEQGQDIFLYLPGDDRPLYTRIELGETFTDTMQSLGVDTVNLPPVKEEE